MGGSRVLAYTAAQAFDRQLPQKSLKRADQARDEYGLYSC